MKRVSTVEAFSIMEDEGIVYDLKGGPVFLASDGTIRRCVGLFNQVKMTKEEFIETFSNCGLQIYD